MDFKRLNKDSSLRIIDMKTTNTGEFATIMNEIEQNGLILQMVINQLADAMIIEYIPTIEHETPFHYIDGGNKIQDGDIEFENALDTVINKDPFGARYSGKRIREIFENGDKSWLDFALKNMHNAFIVDKLKYIISRGGYGKILC